MIHKTDHLDQCHQMIWVMKRKTCKLLINTEIRMGYLGEKIWLQLRSKIFNDPKVHHWWAVPIFSFPYIYIYISLSDHMYLSTCLLVCIYYILFEYKHAFTIWSYLSLCLSIHFRLLLFKIIYIYIYIYIYSREINIQSYLLDLLFIFQNIVIFFYIFVHYELNYHDQIIWQILMHDIWKHWTAILTTVSICRA